MNRTKQLVIRVEFLFLFFPHYFSSFAWEMVRTTKIRTSKTKKNSENHVDDQNVKMVFLVDQNVEKRIITTLKRVDHYYENQNVEKNEKNVKSLIFV